MESPGFERGKKKKGPRFLYISPTCAPGSAPIDGPPTRESLPISEVGLGQQAEPRARMTPT